MKIIKLLFGLLLLVPITAGLTIDGVTNIFLPCYNATSGDQLGTSAKLTCWNSTGDVVLGNVTMSLAGTGWFNWTFSNDSGFYSCVVNCTEDALDTAFAIYKRSVPLIATDNIGINLDDTSGTLDLDELGYVFADNESLTRTKTKIDEANSSLRLFIGNYLEGLNLTQLGNSSDLRASILVVAGYVDDVDSGGIKTVNDIVASATYGNSALKTLIDALTSGQGRLSADINNTNASVYQYFTDGSNEDEFKSDATLAKQNAILAGMITNTSAVQDNLTTLYKTLAHQTNLSQGLVILTPGTEARINYSMNGSLVDDIWDEILTGATHNVATSAGRRLRAIAGFAIRTETAQGGTNNTITLDAAASSTDGIYNRDLIVIVEGDGEGQTRIITEYDGTKKNATVNRNWKITPNATSVFQILANDVEGHPNHGYAQAGGIGNVTLEADASSTDGVYVGDLIYISTGTGAQQARIITGYDGTSKVANVSPNWLVQPDATSLYHIDYQVRVQVDANYDKTDYTLTDGAEDGLIDKIWDENSTDHILNGTFGGHLDANVSAVTSGLLAAISGLNNLSASEVENAVWDANQSDHTTENTTGYNQSKIGMASVTVDNDAVAAAVWNYNISFGMQANTTLYTIYEVLVLTGFSSFAEVLPEPIQTITKMFLFGIEVQRIEFKRY